MRGRSLNLYTFDAPVGEMTLGATDAGLVLAEFTDTGRAIPILEQAVCVSSSPDDHPVLAQACSELAAYFDGALTTFSTPLAPTGTAFQQRVWNALLETEYGQTVTYLELTRRLGDPKAIRAVAAANGANHLALFVPCHRIIGSDGALTGYAGGLWRKRWLLDHERGSGRQLGLF